jgi:hypothetical protein
MPSCAEALERLCDPAGRGIGALPDRRGRHGLSLVDEGARAWHAGAGEWRGAGDVNSRSIGIELANTGREPFAEPQMAALERLLAGLLERHGLGPEAVIAHSDMAPDRKGDPGARFDWRRLAVQGLAVWPNRRLLNRGISWRASSPTCGPSATRTPRRNLADRLPPALPAMGQGAAGRCRPGACSGPAADCG